MPIDPVNPLGWGPKDPITSAQMNGIDQRLVRAVDGVQGGAYTGPVSFTKATLLGTSSIDTSGNIATTGNVTVGGSVAVKGSVAAKGLVSGVAFQLTAKAYSGLVDGADLDCTGIVASVFHLTTAAAFGGTVRVTLTWSWVVANALYIVTLDHSNLPLGHVELTWSGVGMKHRFGGGPDVDGQPTPAGMRDMWTGIALSDTEIYWTITRGLA